jgi:hypothetical protein
MWRRRWSGVPRGIVVAITSEALVLAYGGVVHLFQLVSGWPPYPWAPHWLAAYFTSLTLLDPLAALLLLARRAAGLYLAAFVMVTDAGANWYASYYLPHGTAATKLAQALISGLALASLLIAYQARPWTRQSCLGMSPPSS